MSRNQKNRSKAPAASTKNDAHTRVDRWIKNAKNHPWVAVPVFLAIIIVGLSTVTDSAKRLIQTWENWRHPANDILIEPIIPLQPGFQIEPRIHLATIDSPRSGVGPELDVRWVVLLAITNLTAHPLVIRELAVNFSEDHATGWRLRGSHTGVDAYVADTEDSYRDESPDDKPFHAGAIVVPAGSKRYYAFQLLFDLYQGDQQMVLTDAAEARRAVMLAIGGDIDNHGDCRVVIGPMNGTFTFTNEGIIDFDTKTALFVPPCYVAMPAIVK